nr:hypothetical protein [Nonomuraea lactucae]
MDKAFRAFFDRVKAGRTPGFPRFKGRGWFDTVEWPKDGDGCRWDCQPEHPAATFVRLQGIGHVRVHQHRRVLGTVKTISVKREGSRWFVVLSCEDVPAETLPATGAAVGLDMGVASLVTTSDGAHVANPRHLAATADRLAAAQRDLAPSSPVRRAGTPRTPTSTRQPTSSGQGLPFAGLRKRLSEKPPPAGGAPTIPRDDVAVLGMRTCYQHIS